MKIISNDLYEEYTKTTIDYHTDYSEITKQQLYDTFKFHCQGQRLLYEVVDYIYNLIQKDNKYEESLKNSDGKVRLDEAEDYRNYFKSYKVRKHIKGTEYDKALIMMIFRLAKEVDRLKDRVSELEKESDK